MTMIETLKKRNMRMIEKIKSYLWAHRLFLAGAILVDSAGRLNCYNLTGRAVVGS